MNTEDFLKEVSWALYPKVLYDKAEKLRHVEVNVLNSKLSIKNNLIDNLTESRTILEGRQRDLQRQVSKLESQLEMDGSLCKAELVTLNRTVGERDSELARKGELLMALQEQIRALQLAKETLPIPKAALDILNGYYTKYPEANIFSNAHYFGIKKHVFNIPLQTWAQQGVGCSEFVNFAKKNSAMVYKIMDEETNADFMRACDFSAARVESHVEVDYHWDFDTHGVEDYWPFAIEVHYDPEEDCDGYGTYKNALMASAGIPELMRRNICGNTRGTGDGHFTNTYFASDLAWRHLNSTQTFDETFTDAKQAPGIHDSNDPHGINSPWYAFNADKTWQGFPTVAAAENYKKSQEHWLLKRILVIHK